MGGNAKTLMFCNISPSDYNTDETINSLQYASRVKLVTNEVTRNVENKQNDKMRRVIEKLLHTKEYNLDKILEANDEELKELMNGCG